jgi:hypothetical protein
MKFNHYIYQLNLAIMFNQGLTLGLVTKFNH